MEYRIVYSRWREGSNIRAIKRRVEKLKQSARDGIESIKAGFAYVWPKRKPRRLIDMSPEQKVAFIALLNGDGRR